MKKNIQIIVCYLTFEEKFTTDLCHWDQWEGQLLAGGQLGHWKLEAV